MSDEQINNEFARTNSSNKPDSINPEDDHFARAHGGLHDKRGKHHDGHEPLSWQHLLKPPVIRQWLFRGRLFKGTKERQPTYVELFFDLTFVGIIHQLAEGAVEPKASGLNVAKFVLVFYPSWSIWSNVRDFINQSGTDDILQRIYVLLNMILLVGYSANATGVEVEYNAEGHSEIVPETYSALHAATAFFLVAKAIRLFLFGWYWVVLPKFRITLLLQALQVFIPCLLWLPLTVLHEGHDKAVIVLGTLAIGLDLGIRWVLTVLNRWSHDKSISYNWHVPALSIEHAMERTTAFVVIVLGENILNSVFAAHGEQVGFDDEFGCAALAVFIAFEIMWLYFDADSSRMFIHALRRNWVTSIVYTQLHWVLCGALILASAAQREMVIHAEVEQGYRWYFGAGLGLAILCTAFLGWCHDSLDKPKTAVVDRRIRLLLRVLVAILFALLPLTPNHSTRITFGVYAAVLALLIFLETAGKIGAEGDWESADLERDMTESGPGAEEEHGDIHARREKLRDRADLTEAEKGESDTGVESGLTAIEAKALRRGQRLAYVA